MQFIPLLKRIAKSPRFSLKRAAPAKFSRNEYKAQWNSVSVREDNAKFAVSGYLDEALYASTAESTKSMLMHLVGINTTDVVLEIGAGVGRAGSALAPICKEWIGTDVSENMIGHLRRRLEKFSNVRAVATSGYDLKEIESESVDVVYCTVVFMHLEEWERFSYVSEGWRILRPGGRMLVDNVNLLSDSGWAFFQEHCAVVPSERPAQISKTSTPQELETYFKRAGFTGIEQRWLDLWITTFGVKPTVPHEAPAAA